MAEMSYWYRSFPDSDIHILWYSSCFVDLMKKNLYTHKKNLLTQFVLKFIISTCAMIWMAENLHRLNSAVSLQKPCLKKVCRVSELLHVGTSVCPSDKQQSIIIFSLQASPMKLECLTTGKLGNFLKLLVKWWRWASNTHSVFAFRCLQGQIHLFGVFMCCLEFIVKGEFLWIPEHHSSGFSWPTTSVHRAPAAGRLALEQARGSHPRPGWALNEKLLILMKCNGCVWKEFCCVALYVNKPASCLWTHIV